METVKAPPERRTALRNIRWETYERLLADHLGSSSPPFTYDRGALEIMVVRKRHERPNRLIAQLVEVLAEEMKIDPNFDPPPALIIEVGITSPSPSRFPIYARFGVPEIWRYDGERVLVYGLRDGGYTGISESLALTGFVRDGLTLRRRAWTRQVREWARNHALPSN